jgi:membrane protease YdiL (CAAX protease family)
MLESLRNRLRSAVDDIIDGLAEMEKARIRQTAADLRAGDVVDWGLIGLFVVVAVNLTVLEFFGSSSDWRAPVSAIRSISPMWADSFHAVFSGGRYARLYELCYWVFSTALAYLVIPGLYCRWVMGLRGEDIGLSTDGLWRHAWIYALMFVIVLPAVWGASHYESFQNTYPFYDNAGRSAVDFLAWELIYGVQFICLEYLFRGVLIHGLKRRLGVYAICVSVIPYCMIHFGKPMPEAIGAIVAGLALGACSLLTGSIWLGAAIHISVAVTMDMFAIL